jgi:hypothetical protein
LLNFSPTSCAPIIAPSLFSCSTYFAYTLPATTATTMATTMPKAMTPGSRLGEPEGFCCGDLLPLGVVCGRLALASHAVQRIVPFSCPTPPVPMSVLHRKHRAMVCIPPPHAVWTSAIRPSLRLAPFRKAYLVFTWGKQITLDAKDQRAGDNGSSPSPAGTVPVSLRTSPCSMACSS